MANWWEQFPITQQFGGGALGATEQGVDIGTPFRTAITAPYSGTVQSAGYFPWGGQVDLSTAIPGQPGVHDESVLHLDQITVSPGQPVAAGGLLGYSGGQNVGGSHPAAPQYSSGPHTELDFFSGKPFASAPFNPAGILGIGQGGGLPSFPNPVGDVAGAVAGIPTTIGHGLADAIGAGVTDVGVFFRRQAVALFVAAVVLFVLFQGDR